MCVLFTELGPRLARWAAALCGVLLVAPGLLFAEEAARAEQLQVSCDDTLDAVIPAFVAKTRLWYGTKPLIDRLSAEIGLRATLTIKDDQREALEAIAVGSADIGIFDSLGGKHILDASSAEIFAFTSGWKIVAMVLVKSEISSLADGGISTVSAAKDSLSEKLLRAVQRKHSKGDSPAWEVRTHLSDDDVIFDLLRGKAQAIVIADIEHRRLAPSLGASLRSIATLGESPGGVLVVGPCVSVKQQEAMLRVLLQGMNDEAVATFLDLFQLESFRPVSKSDLESLSRLP